MTRRLPVSLLAAADGSDRRIVTTLPYISDAAWSPDGETMAYVADQRARAMPISGGTPWPLTPSDIAVVELDRAL